MSQLSTQPYKGTRDFYPSEMRFRQWMFGLMREVAHRYGFEEYDGPMLEAFELYAAKTGEEIVNKQLYSLVDQGDRKLAVRPEMTPTLARMVAGRLKELSQPIRWFSIPNLWRYERPQRGRLREHWQLNVDILGGEKLSADVEILCLALDLVGEFGGLEHVKIRFSHRGLVDFFFKEKLGLNEDQAQVARKAVDAREKVGEDSYRDWLSKAGIKESVHESLEKFFSTSSFGEMAKLSECEALEYLRKFEARLGELRSDAGERVVFDPKIMRGMDYYTGVVFEMYDTSPENNRAMFGGGRYDNLIGLFGKDELSGVGFGWGDVTTEDFIRTHGLTRETESLVDVFLSCPEGKGAEAVEIERMLRAEKIALITPLSEGSFKKQLKMASKMKARFAVLLGDSELKEKKVMVKNLVARSEEAVSISDLARYLKKELKS